MKMKKTEAPLGKGFPGMRIFDFFIHEDAYPDFDARGAVSRLSRALTFETVTESPAPGAFEGLHAHVKESFPALMEQGTFETIRSCILITVKGSDPSLKPALFMSHQDVVPVVPGTEKDWTHAPFSGDVADGYVWGRGAEDIKQQVMASMEAMEYLLEKGFQPKRTVFFAFADDEETVNNGSKMICEVLEKRGVSLEFLLDEGGGKLYDAAPFGAPGVMVSDICMMEKGYADLELTTKSKGGHSSRPVGGSSLEVLARAIAAICEHPFPYRADAVLKNAFSLLKPHITEDPLKTLLAADPVDWEAVAAYCAFVPELFPYMTTTIAPTMIEGGSTACNVLPQDMRAVINFRLASGMTPELLMEHCRKAVSDERVELCFLQANAPSIISETDSFGYRKLTETLSRFFTGVQFIPLETVGATDAKNYESICKVCMRFSPFIIPEEDLSGVHGTNERILIRSYIHGIRVLIDFMEHTL